MQSLENNNFVHLNNCSECSEEAMNFRERLVRDQDGELLTARDKKYSSKCFVGNWSGERLEQDVS